MVDPNAESDTDEARGFMNRIVTGWAGAIAALVVVVLRRRLAHRLPPRLTRTGSRFRAVPALAGRPRGGSRRALPAGRGGGTLVADDAGSIRSPPSSLVLLLVVTTVVAAVLVRQADRRPAAELGPGRRRRGPPGRAAQPRSATSRPRRARPVAARCHHHRRGHVDGCGRADRRVRVFTDVSAGQPARGRRAPTQVDAALGSLPPRSVRPSTCGSPTAALHGIVTNVWPEDGNAGRPRLRRHLTTPPRPGGDAPR